MLGAVTVCLFQAAKLAKMRIPPSEMFLSETDKYSKFDENVSTLFFFQNSVRLIELGWREFSALGERFLLKGRVVTWLLF